MQWWSDDDSGCDYDIDGGDEEEEEDDDDDDDGGGGGVDDDDDGGGDDDDDDDVGVYDDDGDGGGGVDDFSLGLFLVFWWTSAWVLIKGIHFTISYILHGCFFNISLCRNFYFETSIFWGIVVSKLWV